MPATPAWLASIEALFNRSIDAGTQATLLARRLNGTSLQLDVDGLTHIRAGVSGGRLALTKDAQGTADAVISGSAWTLLQLLTGARQAAGRASAQIRGNAEIAGLYRELFTAARPDAEEELSRIVGDLPARRLSQFGVRALSWVRKTGRTAGENLAEYLQEESRDLVNRTELEEFLHGVDALRESADRVEERLSRLEQRLKGAG